jgi:hypothetical protein
MRARKYAGVLLDGTQCQCNFRKRLYSSCRARGLRRILLLSGSSARQQQRDLIRIKRAAITRSRPAHWRDPFSNSAICARTGQ